MSFEGPMFGGSGRPKGEQVVCLLTPIGEVRITAPADVGLDVIRAMLRSFVHPKGPDAPFEVKCEIPSCEVCAAQAPK